jgi:hypothetical protein
VFETRIQRASRLIRDSPAVVNKPLPGQFALLPDQVQAGAPQHQARNKNGHGEKRGAGPVSTESPASQGEFILLKPRPLACHQIVTDSAVPKQSPNSSS